MCLTIVHGPFAHVARLQFSNLAYNTIVVTRLLITSHNHGLSRVVKSRTATPSKLGVTDPKACERGSGVLEVQIRDVTTVEVGALQPYPDGPKPSL